MDGWMDGWMDGGREGGSLAAKAIVDSKSKTASAIFSVSKGPMVSCFHTFLTDPPSNHSKVSPIGSLHAQKRAEAGLLHVFK